MKIPQLYRLDVAGILKASSLMGYELGKEAAELFRRALRTTEAISVWNVDVTRASATDYKFVCAFLGPILHNFGEELPTNAAVVVSCFEEIDRWHVLTGIAFQKFEMASAVAKESEDRIVAIRRLNRYFILALVGEEPTKFEYVGTTEENLLRLLTYAEAKECVSVEDIKSALQMTSIEAVEALRILQKRRQILQIFQEGDTVHSEEVFQSVTRLFLSEGPL